MSGLTLLSSPMGRGGGECVIYVTRWRKVFDQDCSLTLIQTLALKSSLETTNISISSLDDKQPAFHQFQTSV